MFFVKKALTISVRLRYNDNVKRLRRLQVSHKAGAKATVKGGGNMSEYILTLLLLVTITEVIKAIKK